MDNFPTAEEEFELMYSDELELLREQDDNFVQHTQINNSANEKLHNKNVQQLQINTTQQNDFPTEEEEVDGMHVDDFELLKEQDIGEHVIKSRKVLDFNNSIQNTSTQQLIVERSSSNHVNDDFTPIDDSNENTLNIISRNGENSNKRTIQELFGDIDDLLSENVIETYGSAPKKHKKSANSNADLALIEHILTLRKLSCEQNNSASSFGKDYTSAQNKTTQNLSYTIPKYSFTPVTNLNGDRIYVRSHSEQYEKEEAKRILEEHSRSGIMGQTFKDIWSEALVLINNRLNLSESEITLNVPEVPSDVEDNRSLWADLYKPRKYFELLSDEGTNRILLRWLKLWDKVVFNIRPKLKPLKVKNTDIKSKFKKQELSLELDEHGRPQYKVALLCGPPGLGKTTLAHMVAKHAGYNVVEINASDDRNLDTFKTALENATTMSSVLDKEKRPNCLVFDEIDGAPTTSIDFLIKFINGGHVTKSKKGKNNTKHILKRPIICICNDVFVPALRSLRQIAFVVNFPPTSSARLAERLCEIARKEQVDTDIGAMLGLAEKSHNDIRSSLSFLHFYKSQNKPVTLSDVMRSTVGEKDVQKGLFTVWNDIFQIERVTKKTSDDKTCIDASLKTRMGKVLQTVNSFGDYDRVMLGVFENYPKMNIKDSSMVGTSQALEWFCFNDILNRTVLTKQDYSLATYLPYGFVIWHFVFASMLWQKVSYPSTNYEMRTRKTKYGSLANEMIRGMRPSIRAYLNPSSLKIDIVPHINQIITPYFRPVNLHLYTQQEKDQLIQVVHIMIDYNLNYIQERNPEGSYSYNLDPNVEELASFPGFKPKRTLTYTNRQLIAREIDLEKMRMVEIQKHNNDKKQLTNNKKVVGKEQVPNHLQKLKAKDVKSEVVVTKDFFGQEVRKVVSASDKSSGPRLKNDIYFKFKEGYTNAVRKKVKIRQLK